ncbi:MAG: hypothetical protein ACRD2C_14470 [Acidimicrobiales bacterium]
MPIAAGDLGGQGLDLVHAQSAPPLDRGHGTRDLALRLLPPAGQQEVGQAELVHAAALPRRPRRVGIDRRPSRVALDHGHVVAVEGEHLPARLGRSRQVEAP